MITNDYELDLDAFSTWFLENREEQIELANNWVTDNDVLREQFLNEWPLERLETMTIDEYVTGKGAQNKSLCYEIEHGKFKNLYLSILGGSAGKFGIYWSKKHEAYCDQNNRPIAESDVSYHFNKLRKDLVEIIYAGINRDFTGPVLKNVPPFNSFFGKTATIIKLLCTYSPKGTYSGINTASDRVKIWDKVAPAQVDGWVYRQNYEITQGIINKYPELKGDSLGWVLWGFREFTYNKITQVEPVIDIEVNYEKNLSNILVSNYNIVLRGAPGTGKTYLAKQIAADIISNGSTTVFNDLSDEEKGRFGFVQFHPSYDYTDFVEGLRPKKNGDGFYLQTGVFTEFVNQAKINLASGKNDHFVFVIDEINRGEISKIFGELFYSIDPGYRGDINGVRTQYANLHDNPTEKFYIPKNVYIIGTMNDIDRSVDTFDFAMRRRFTFIEITADQSAKAMLKNIEIVDQMQRLNNAIVEIGELTTDYHIGASYFIDLVAAETDSNDAPLWNNKLQPLLKDYFRGESKAEDKLRQIEEEYFGKDV
ncbi:AAA domain-containing protein [Erysipelothrix sp. HDW6A]|uniref:McrB family protein n=1 Tax=Erysipelothrix sp. HDW6A TaxID=2714928 RepID=UPI00140A600E|nr:AAA family ATPase [Erysipelothrix sp. HDW6A]QIK58187.1 AAA domain-containing protein [Erysipelothrix sp. HDW6A]